jgi:hypothetical protein
VALALFQKQKRNIGMPVRNIFYANPVYFLIKFRSSVQVVVELTRVIYGKISESSHLGLLTRVESFFILDSSLVAENSNSSRPSSPSQ